jgi:integrase/recombinase XerC
MAVNKFIDFLLLEKKYSQHTAVAYQRDIEMFQLFLTNEFSVSEVFSNPKLDC